MSYAQPSDMTARYPNRDLVQITNEDPAATVVNTTFLQQYLNDASDEIDSYLESRFALPLNDPPARLNQLCCDIAMYKMQALRPLQDIKDARDRYQDAIKVLEQVAQGKLTLGLSADNVEPPTASPNVLTQAGGDPSPPPPTRIFSRGNLKGF